MADPSVILCNVVQIGGVSRETEIRPETSGLREMVNEGLLARNIFTEFGELRAIIRLPWRRIRSLLEEQL